METVGGTFIVLATFCPVKSKVCVSGLNLPSFSFCPCTYLSALYGVVFDPFTEFRGTFSCSTLSYWTGRHAC